MSDGTLALFWTLADDEPGKRIGAAEALAAALEPHLAAAEAASAELDPKVLAAADAPPAPRDLLRPPPADEFAPAQAALDRFPREVSYAVTRLVRGLASPRASARLGFATALAPLLARCTTLAHNRLSAVAFLKLVLHHTSVSASASGQEGRDALFAKIFAVHALALGPALSETCDPAPNPALQLATRITLAAAASKSWLADAASAVLVQLYRVAREQYPPAAEEWVRNKLFPLPPKKALTSDRLAILMAIQHTLPAPKKGRQEIPDDWAQRVCPPLKVPTVLAPENVPVLGALLLDEAIEADEAIVRATNKRASTWSAELPMSLRLFVELYTSSDRLHKETTSAERKLWGFKTFQAALIGLVRDSTTRDVRDDVKTLFTSNFVRHLVYNSRKTDRLLYAAARQTLDLIGHAAQTPALSHAILEGVHFGSHPGKSAVGSLLPAEVLNSLLQDTSETRAYINAVQDVVTAYLRTPTSKEDEGEAALSPQVAWALDELMHIFRAGGKKDSATAKRILGLLSLYAVMAPQEEFVASEDLGPVTAHDPARAAILAPFALGRLLSVLGDLNDADEHWIPWVWEHICFLASAAFPTEKPKTKGKKRRSSAGPVAATAHWLLPVQMGEAMSGAPLTEKAIDTAEEEEGLDPAVALQAARTELVRLQSQKFATGLALRDLVAACALYSLKEPRGGASALSQALLAATSEEADHGTVVHAVLTCTEQPSAFLRMVAERTFATYATQLGSSAIESVVRRLLPPADGADEEDEELMSDVEEAQSSDASSANESESESESNNEEDDEDDDEQEPDPELVQKLQEALGDDGQKADSDEESIAADDDEMLALDSKLAGIFRLRQREGKSSSKSKRAELAAAVAVQNRVLDLLDVFVRRNLKLAHSGGQDTPGAGTQAATTVFLLQPLLAIVTEAEADNKAATKNKADLSKTKTKARQVRAEASSTKASKASALIARITGAKEPIYLPEGSEARAQALELVGKVLAMLSGPDAVPASQLAEKVVLSLTRSLLHSTQVQEGRDALVTAYFKAVQASLGLGATRKSSLRAKFLTDALNRFPQLGWALRTAPLPALTVTNERKTQPLQALALIQVVAHQAVLAATKGSTPPVAEVQTYLSEAFGAALTLVEEEATLPTATPARVKEEIKFLMAVQRMRRRLDNSAEGSDAEKQRLHALYGALTSGVYAATKSLHTLVAKQLFTLVGVLAGKEVEGKKGQKRGADEPQEDATLYPDADTTAASFVSALDAIPDQSIASAAPSKTSTKKSKKNKKQKTA